MESVRFLELYGQYTPNCSTFKSAFRKGKRLYGEFECDNHGYYKIRGDDLKNRGCSSCTRAESKRLYDEQWKRDCTEIHGGKFDYTNTEVGDVLKKSFIKCNDCKTIFKQTPASHKSGRGCPVCVLDVRGKWNLKTIEDVKKQSKEIGFNYDFSKSIYITCKDNIEIVCDKGHTFFQSPDELINAKHGCKYCSKSKQISKGEKELYNFISEFYNCEENDRKLLQGKEIDIYIPKIKVGIEFNGLYWHSDERVKLPHHDKHNLAAKNGVHLISIYENDWEKRKELVKDKIKNNLKIRQDGFKDVFFKNVEIREEFNDEILKIFKDNSLESISNIDGFYTMYFNNELISIASYIHHKSDIIITEIVRPLESTPTDYYTNFIKHFSNQDRIFKIVVSIDWLDDMTVISEGGIFEKLLKNRKYFIYKQDLHKKELKEGLKTLTKAGYTIYKI